MHNNNILIENNLLLIHIYSRDNETNIISSLRVIYGDDCLMRFKYIVLKAAIPIHLCLIPYGASKCCIYDKLIIFNIHLLLILKNFNINNK